MVVFDGVGDDAERGPLSVRYAPDADTLLERLAAETARASGWCSSRPTRPFWAPPAAEVANLSSQTFFRDLAAGRGYRERPPGGLADKLDDETRARLERLRRGAANVTRVHCNRACVP